jgi:hypothetical protein
MRFFFFEDDMSPILLRLSFNLGCTVPTVLTFIVYIHHRYCLCVEGLSKIKTQIFYNLAEVSKYICNEFRLYTVYIHYTVECRSQVINGFASRVLQG